MGLRLAGLGFGVSVVFLVFVRGGGWFGFFGEGGAVAELVLYFHSVFLVLLNTSVVVNAGAGTDIPEAWMVVSWVGEKIRWPPSLAAVKRLTTSVERFSERPNCIFAVTCQAGYIFLV